MGREGENMLNKNKERELAYVVTIKENYGDGICRR